MEKVINLASSSALRPDSNFMELMQRGKSQFDPYLGSCSRVGSGQYLVNCIMPLAKSTGMEWWMNEYPDEANEFLKTIPFWAE